MRATRSFLARYLRSNPFNFPASARGQNRARGVAKPDGDGKANDGPVRAVASTTNHRPRQLTTRHLTCRAVSRALRGERFCTRDMRAQRAPARSAARKFLILFIANLSAHSRVVSVSRANELARQPRGTTRRAFDRSIFLFAESRRRPSMK